MCANKNRGRDEDLGDDFASFLEVFAATDVGPGQEVLNEPDANIVAHLLELLVYLSLVLIVLQQLRHHRSVRQREQLRILEIFNSENGQRGANHDHDHDHDYDYDYDRCQMR